MTLRLVAAMLVFALASAAAEGGAPPETVSSRAEQVDDAQFRKDVDHLVRNATGKKEHASR
jgi:hypothetical protein